MAIATSRPKLRTAFKKARTIAPLYTSGPVAVTPDGSRIVTCVGEEILFTEVSTGAEICRFASDFEAATALCISPSSAHLLVFTSSQSLRIFSLSTSLSHVVQPVRVVARAHDAPVHVCKADPTSTYLASGSADGVVKVWDIVRGYVTHVFKGHGGVVSALAFNYPQDPSSISQKRTMQLITASVDTRIRIFELSTTAGSKGSLKPQAVLEGHVSVPRGLSVSLDGKWLVSGGRDSVVLVWNLESSGDTPNSKDSKSKGKGKAAGPTLAKTIPILERVEAIGILDSDADVPGTSSTSGKIKFYTGGENGVIKVWDALEGTVLFTLGRERANRGEDDEESTQIVDVLYTPATAAVISVHADQNILFYSLSTRSLTRQLVGYNDEIVDATFLSPRLSSLSAPLRDSHLALATNSPLIRVYSTTSQDSRLLEGHTDIVLSLDHSADGLLLASSSKDRSVRIWAPLKPGADGESEWGYQCVAVCEGHAESVGALALSRQAASEESLSASSPRFMFTGSQDRTIKMWDLSQIHSTYAEPSNAAEPVRCKSLMTLKAHEKDINSLDVSPNDKLLVSGSQDRTAKIFSIDYLGGLRELGVCKGHKRGVWTAKFGRVERVLATGSGDKTVKLWNLDDFSCVKTFEGHTNSVLRVDFLNAGMQLVSAASDGLVKLWNVKDEECTTTMDNHEDKVWALAVSSDERTIVSGAADSVVTFWEDCTEEQEQEKEAKREDTVSKEQDFLNYLSLNDYRKAIQLALAMEQPGRLLSLFTKIRSSPSSGDTLTGDASVDEVIRTLCNSDLAKLLGFVRDWNVSARTSRIAQGVLNAIVKLRPAENIMKAFTDNNILEEGQPVVEPGKSATTGGTALKELIDALVPYTERHLTRLERLVQESYMVDYILAEMDDGMIDGEIEDVNGMDVDDNMAY